MNKTNIEIERQFLENITASACDDKFYFPRVFLELIAIVGGGLIIALAFALSK